MRLISRLQAYLDLGFLSGLLPRYLESSPTRQDETRFSWCRGLYEFRLLGVILLVCLCSGHDDLRFWEIGYSQAAPQKVIIFSGEDIRARVHKVVERSPLLKDLEIAEIKPPRFSSQRAPQGAQLSVEVVGEIRGGRIPVEVSLSKGKRLLRKLRSFVEVDLKFTLNSCLKYLF